MVLSESVKAPWGRTLFGLVLCGFLVAAFFLITQHAAHLFALNISGSFLVMVGRLAQWPTIVMLAMFPVLVFMYGRLARIEERESLAEFGPAYERYMHDVPGFLLRLGDILRRPSDRRGLNTGARP